MNKEEIKNLIGAISNITTVIELLEGIGLATEGEIDGGNKTVGGQLYEASSRLTGLIESVFHIDFETADSILARQKCDTEACYEALSLVSKS